MKAKIPLENRNEKIIQIEDINSQTKNVTKLYSETHTKIHRTNIRKQEHFLPVANGYQK